MKLKYYIMGLAALSLCTACDNDKEAIEGIYDKNEILFTASLENTVEATERAASRATDKVLGYVNGIYVRKIGSETVDAEYNVKNGNKGTLEVVTGETYLKWSDTERTDNSDVHFYAWTTPTGVSLTKEDNAVTGTINFGHGEDEGNRAPKTSNEDPKNTYDTKAVTPLEVFISTHTSGKYKENPNISFPFKHQVSKVGIQVYNDKNANVTDEVTITFPFIKKIWSIKQTQEGDDLSEFVVNEAMGDDILSLEFKKLALSDDYRIFYLPPMTGANSFTNIGDFELKYGNKIYYGTLATRIEKLDKGEYMQCRIDLNENYSTGVGAEISPWVNGDSGNAYVNPYRGIYSLKGLEVLKDCLDKKTPIPDSLYIEDNSKKIIRLYKDLTLTQDLHSLLVLEDNMVFDGLGHTITVPGEKSLFGDVTTSTTPTTTNSIEIKNIRLLGAGQLASSLANVTVYNCHANGTGNLVGTADGTTFNFCSAENSAKDIEITLMGAVGRDEVTVTNSFVASSATAFVSNTGGTVTAKNSFIISTSKNTYWSAGTTSENSGTFTIEENNVTATTVTIGSNTRKLIDFLNEGSKDSGNTWVYVYDKSYPVMRIK